MMKRPLSVTIIGILYIVTGVVSSAFHLSEYKVQHPFQWDIVWIELVGLVAVVSGVFLLRGQNWARWLALAWMAFHVILSIFNTPRELAIHCLFFVILAYFLFRTPAVRYFRGG